METKEIRFVVPDGADLYAVAIAGYKQYGPNRSTQSIKSLAVFAYSPEQAKSLAIEKVTANGEAFHGDDWSLISSVCLVTPTEQ